MENTIQKLKEIIKSDSWNSISFKYATIPDPETGVLTRINCLLFEPRSAKQLQNDGGFYSEFLIAFPLISRISFVLVHLSEIVHLVEIVHPNQVPFEFCFNFPLDSMSSSGWYSLVFRGFH